MTYDVNIPSEEQSPSVSQPGIKINYFEYDRIFKLNHMEMNNDNEGNHSFVIFKNQSSDPSVIPPVGTLFGKIGSGVANSANVFFKTSKFLPNQENTAELLTFNVAANIIDQYQSFMMGGYIVYFGIGLTPLAGSNTITFAFGAIPVCTKTVFISVSYAGFNLPVDSYTNSSFNVTVPFATSLNYFVIGKV